MKTIKTDSTSNVSRFARDKRQRVNTSERVERSPRPRREADSEEQREFRPRVANKEKRSSYNPHFTADNRLRPEYEERKPRAERAERGERGERTERNFNRSERPQRGERTERRSDAKGGAKRGFAPKRDEKPRSYPKYNPNRATGEIRLNRFIAQSGVCSRREADEFILAGVVTVNGQVVTELGTKILPTDEVRFNDEKLQGEKHVYIVLNKPKGYVTSLDDPHADKTVMDLVKNACTERVYPVGRLDKNSLGLLLITNDGDITRQLTHPSYRKKKIYQVTLDKPLTRADMDALTEGITLEDGDIFADEVAYASEDKKTIGVEIHSGRNRIVRRMFEHLGYTVQKLDRVYYAGLTKKNLKRGDWRFLTKDEVMRLKTGQYE
ncbi:MAG: pseudouridine synthase [Alistipes sp.]|nr:pseudouridine synthase [Alistipes sp.]